MSKFDDLMEKLKISAVYWIDDENAQGAEVDLEKSSATYVDALLSVEADERRRALAPLLSQEVFRQRANNILRIASADGEEIQSKADRIAPILRQVIEESDDQVGMLRNLREKLPGPLPLEQRNALVQLFTNEGHESWKWTPLSFTQWQELGPAVLHEHTPDQPALFIIDLQNASEVTPVDGKTVLSQVAQAEIDRHSCHLVVLTSECKEKEEYKRGRQLTEEIFNQHQDRRVPVFALSKHRFVARVDAGNEDVSPAFESVLERANLSLLHLNLTQRIRSHFVSSIDSAFNALDRLTIEELMYAVTHTSKKEGVPEIDTLVRLTSIAQREALQKAIVEEVELRNAILALRQSELSIEKDQLEIDDEITAMRSAELYDRAEVVNPLYSALSPGDLFVVERKNEIREGQDEHAADNLVSETYVLVANACDLMLRGEGPRKLSIGLMMKLDDTQGDKSFSFELPYLKFLENVDRPARYIELRKFVSMPLDVLDLCWLNADGTCVWQGPTSHEQRAKLLASQRVQLDIIEKSFDTATEPEIRTRAALLGTTCDISSEENGRITRVKFGIRRVGRLTHSHAAQLTTRFSSTIGRPSSFHDFA